MQKWPYETGTTGCFEDVADAYVDVVCYMGICHVYGKDGDACKAIEGCLRQTCVQ